MRTVRFTRTTTDWADVSVEIPDGATNDEIADAALASLHEKDPGWEPVERCFDEWENYEILADEEEGAES